MGTPVVTAQGNVVDVAPEDAAQLVAAGGHVEAPEERASGDVQGALAKSGNAVEAFGQGFGRGITFGGTDALQRSFGGDVASDYLRNLREQHPFASTTGMIAGAIAPALLSDGASADLSLAELTPAGFTTRIGSKIAGLGEGGSAVARIGATAGGAALEGAAQNAGSYISDVALGDHPLTAEGFLGAMGKGALYGGVAGGALSVAHNGFIAARRLIPEAEATPEAIAAAKAEAKQAVSDSVQTSDRLGRSAQDQIDRTTRETQQFLSDLEAERAAALGERRVAEVAPADGAPAEAIPTTEAEAAKPKPAPMPPEAKELLAKWREKYGGGAVDYDAANAAARRGRLAEWAKDFEPKNPEDEAVKAYFENPQDPMRTAERMGGAEVPTAVKRAANDAAAKASHDAYNQAIADATNVSKSGTELMARSIYAARRSAARALDDVYTAYRAGTPIADITAAATKRLGDQMRELADARADMIKSLAREPNAGDLTAQLQATLDRKVPLGERILRGVEKPASPDEVIAKALGKSKDVNADIADVAPKITRYEAAKARLTESLGDKASPEAIAHAQAFRQAQQEAEGASARGAAQASENIDKVLERGIPADKAAGGKSIFSGLAKKAGDYGAAYEMLRDLGVPLPDPKSVPVIGPILSLFLKAKLLGKVAGKFGGSFAATAEGTIAAKAAETRNRINGAIGTMLDTGANATAKATTVIGGPAALAHKLFDAGPSPTPYSSETKPGKLEDDYRARLAELTAANKPGAIEEAIRSRITTGDPRIVDAIIEAQTKSLSYLYNVAPKPDAPAYPGQPERSPSKTEILGYGDVLAAYHDPAAIFERVAAGGTARPAEIDCVKNCYAQLYADAQKTLVSKLGEAGAAPSYMRRVAVSALVGLPLDASMAPDRAARLQTGFATPAAPTAAPSPHPTLTASVDIGQRTLTRLDR